MTASTPMTARERLERAVPDASPAEDAETALRRWVRHLDSPAVRDGSPAAAMTWAVREIDHLRGRLAEARERAELAETRQRIIPAKIAAVVQAAYRFADSPSEDASTHDALLDAVADLGRAQLREPEKAEG